MPSAERSIIIDRPPDQVFAFFADPGNDQQWRPHVKEISSADPAQVAASRAFISSFRP